jgi:hypothetical protein
MFAVAEVWTRVLQVLKPNDIFDLVNNCLSDIPLREIAQAASTAGSSPPAAPR